MTGVSETGWAIPRLSASNSGRTHIDTRAARAATLAVPLQLASCALALVFAYLALRIGLSVQPHTTLDVVRAVAEALAVALPVFAGVYALRREQTARFARLLVITGLAWAPSVLALSDRSVPYSLGRPWAWGVLAGVVYLLLAFPVGRLATRADQLIAGCAFAIIGLLYLPTALIAPFPVPSPWSGCGTSCPANALQVTSAPTLTHAVTNIRDVLSGLICLAAVAAVSRRWLRGSPLARRVHGPVFAVALMNLSMVIGFVVLRRVGPEWSATEVTGVVWLATMPALALAFLFGLARWRVVAATAWRELTPATAAAAAPRGIRDVIAEALQDPSLEIGYWGGPEQRWLDERGRPFALPPTGSVRSVTEVTAGREPLAILVHENSALADPAIREVVQGVGLIALMNQRTEADARARLRELSESRARIVGAIDRDRVRIERNLHDGAQQRLIALMIVANRGAETAAGSDGSAELFKRIQSEAAAALDEVRALARGVYPPLLVDRGLVDALSDAARRSAVRTMVQARGIGRYPQEVEAAVYFCCLEAMQNAEKHAGARSISIDLSGNGTIAFEVRDDGGGFDQCLVREGAGLAHMRDRVAAVGGRVRIESVVGGGTLVAGSVPMLPTHVPAEIEQLVLRATDALEDALGIYRAVRTARGTIVDFAIEHVNDAACRMTGLTREAQVGKTLGQLLPDYPRSPLFEWHCEALEAGAPLVREEVEYGGAGGRIDAAYEVRAVALGAERLALLRRDVTDAARARRGLELRAEALAGEGAGVSIVRADSGTIVYANRELERMLGFGAGELEGRRSTDLDASEPGSRQVGVLSAGQFEARCRCKDGSVIACEVTLDGFHDRYLGWCWVAVHRDVTAVREQQTAVAEYSDRLQRALHGLPALGYATDTELHPSLLFDNLVHQGNGGLRSGDAAELFGSELGAHVAEVNRRVRVTRRPATVEVDVDLVGPAHVALSAEPVLTRDGAIAGVVGSVLRVGPVSSAGRPGTAELP
jgi:PAS domain S-box-containing protein